MYAQFVIKCQFNSPAQMHTINKHKQEAQLTLWHTHLCTCVDCRTTTNFFRILGIKITKSTKMSRKKSEEQFFHFAT